MKPALLLLSLMLVSCTQSLNVQDYIAWNQDEDNGLYQSVEREGYQFKLQYKPQELVALNNAGDLSGLDKTQLNEELEELKEYQFFDIHISSNLVADFLRARLSSQEEYYQRVAYFSTFAQDDFKLVEGQDTLACIMYHFERNYGIRPFQTILLGFKNTPGSQDKDKEVLYEDRILGLNTVNLRIESKNLNNIPQLSL